MSQSENNAKLIKENKKKIFQLDSEVMTNKAKIYESRSMIEENRLMILSNYSAAFMGNRQLANNNTDEIFTNRNAIIANLKATNEVEQNFINAQNNKASLDFLKHRSELNSSVLELSEEMAELNLKMIDINKRIMDTNQSIIEYNSTQIAINKDLLDGNLQPSNANPEKNAELINVNSNSMSELESKVLKNRVRMEEIISKSQENTNSLIENKILIKERRESIVQNRDGIIQNKINIFN